MSGHPFTRDGLGLTRSDDLAGLGLDTQDTAIQLLHRERKATERLNQGDGLLHVQVLTLTLEALVLLFLQYNNDISWDLDVRVLVSLTRESDLVIVLHALIHIDLQDFLLLGNTVPVASGASVFGVHCHTLTLASGACSLHLLHHPRAQLPHHDADTLATAVTAGTSFPLLFGARPVTSLADDLLVEGQLPHLPVVQVFKGHWKGMTDILAPAFSWATTTKGAATTTKELREDVMCRHASSSTATFLKSLFTITVILLAHVLITQHFVGPSDLLEFLCRLGSRVFIRMVKYSHFPVCFLDVAL
mmetsp:Transcript_11556/g.20873  ORF Transcript_11556/g.20873 Transcript_11556/m.20873 type:complete len:303 (+) Transcript_11556:1743-2651(+)